MTVFRSFTPLMAAILLVSTTGCERPSAANPPSGSTAAAIERVQAGTATRKTLSLYTTQPGRIGAYEETPLYAKISAYVDDVLVDIGDPVKKGQTLVTLWIPELQNELQQKAALVAQAEAEIKQAEAAVQAAQAAVNSAQARVSQAEAGTGRAEGEFDRWQGEYERLRQLAAGGSVTQKLVDETRNQFRAAEAARLEAAAQVQSAQALKSEAEARVLNAQADELAAQARLQVAEANRRQTETLLGYAEIQAPFDGVVTRREVDTRHFVHPANGGGSKPLVVVARTDLVRVAVDIPEMESSLVDAGERGDTAVVRVQSQRKGTFDGKVSRTSWSLDASNRSLRTEIDLANTDQQLRPGMYASVTVLLERRENVLTLPVSAIVRDGDQTFCCLIVSGRIERRAVELGLRSGGEVEVLSGLDESQPVVLMRAESLQPGQPVEVIATAK